MLTSARWNYVLGDETIGAIGADPSFAKRGGEGPGSYSSTSQLGWAQQSNTHLSCFAFPAEEPMISIAVLVLNSVASAEYRTDSDSNLTWIRKGANNSASAALTEVKEIVLAELILHQKLIPAEEFAPTEITSSKTSNIHAVTCTQQIDTVALFLRGRGGTQNAIPVVKLCPSEELTHTGCNLYMRLQIHLKMLRESHTQTSTGMRLGKCIGLYLESFEQDKPACLLPMGAPR
eukprot:5656632-Amphidinium_carterae.1